MVPWCFPSASPVTLAVLAGTATQALDRGQSLVLLLCLLVAELHSFLCSQLGDHIVWGL